MYITRIYVHYDWGQARLGEVKQIDHSLSKYKISIARTYTKESRMIKVIKKKWSNEGI